MVGCAEVPVVKEDGCDRQLRLLLLEMEGGELVVSGAVF